MTAESRSQEAALVRSAQAGDRAAFGVLYQQYRPVIHGIMLAHAEYAAAEDLMQDTFVRALEQLPTLREAATFGAWVITIARHMAMDQHRRRKPERLLSDTRKTVAVPSAPARRLSELLPLSGRVSAPFAPAKEYAGARGPDGEAFAVLKVIQTLPESYRETLVLRLVEGMTGPEIAARTGLTADSVRVNLCRGMKLLRGLLEDKVRR